MEIPLCPCSPTSHFSSKEVTAASSDRPIPLSLPEDLGPGPSCTNYLASQVPNRIQI
jgi:hypothetical protein